jgi:hypothetical protein
LMKGRAIYLVYHHRHRHVITSFSSWPSWDMSLDRR